ncbi:hypothetical protein FQZ97_820090 [compost metagenome]
MPAGLGADRREGLHLGAVLLHVLLAGATEQAQGVGHACAFREHATCHVHALAVGRRTIGPMVLQRARLHLLEAEGQRAIDHAAFHRLTGQPERRGTAAAVVVDVDHRDAGQAHFIERRLAAGGVAVDVAGIGLLHQLVVDAGILQRQADGFGTHLDIGTALAGLGKRDHADTGNVDFLRHLFSPGTGDRASLVAPERRRSWRAMNRWSCNCLRSLPPPVEGDWRDALPCKHHTYPYGWDPPST